MWKNEYLNLEEALPFLVEKIEYNSGTGFSFCSIVCGNTFDEAFEFIAEPDIYNTESEQQQTAEYTPFIDHPVQSSSMYSMLTLHFRVALFEKLMLVLTTWS